jgi:hypothetical protein
MQTLLALAAKASLLTLTLFSLAQPLTPLLFQATPNPIVGNSRLASYARNFKLDIDQEIVNLVEDVRPYLQVLGPEFAYQLEDELIAAILSKNPLAVTVVKQIILGAYSKFLEHAFLTNYLSCISCTITKLTNKVLPLSQLLLQENDWLKALVTWRENMHDEEWYYGLSNSALGGITTSISFISPAVGCGCFAMHAFLQWTQGKDKRKFIEVRRQHRKEYLEKKARIEQESTK